MAAIDEDAGKNRHTNHVAEQQQQKAAKRQPLGTGTSPHQAADPAAEPAGDAPLGQERNAAGKHHPAEIDQRAQGRAVLVEGAPFAGQRFRGVRQHADIRHRLGFELHGDVFDPAGGTHLACRRRGRGGRGNRLGRRRHGRRIGRAGPPGGNQNQRQDREPDQAPPRSGRASDACEPQLHAPASRRTMRF